MVVPGSTEPTSIGRYELTSTLGVGGFAVVYRAHDPALDAEVAIKILLERYTDNADVRQRFLQEARLLRRVESPNVVRVYDIGEAADGRPFFVMELAEGGILAGRWKGMVEPGCLVEVIDSLAAGLGALHEANVVHRDIKPDNLLITGTRRDTRPEEVTEIGVTLLAEGERLVIGDLGLAKDQGRTATGPTVAGGTPRYRAPEQMQSGAPITPAADIYAATGVLWFLLTGKNPPETDAIPLQLAALPAAWQPLFERGFDPDPTLRHLTIDAWAQEAKAAVGHVSEGRTLSGGGMAAGSPQPERGTSLVNPIDVCPYKGMAAFQPDDAALYFGRDELIDTLVGRLQHHPVVVVGGPSGSGKSSLVRAGLIPRLGRGAIAGSQQWRIALFTPGSDAIGELLYHVNRLASSGQTTAELGPDTNRTPEPQPSGALTRDELPQGARRLLDVGPPVVLVVDQFEELFTLNPDPVDRELFLDTLSALTSSVHSRVKVVLALRADFYGVCAEHPWLNARINESQLLVGPMSRQELRSAITTPAQRTGLGLEPGLADTILDDIGQGIGGLPLLGHALMETWLRRRGSRLTIEGYRAAGGVSGAIAQRAEDIYGQLSADEQEATRRLVLQLINPGQGTPDTRRRVRRNDLPDDPALEDVLEKLASARLLTVDGPDVEVAHEALIGTWPRLQNWIDADRESLQIRRRIGIAADEWQASQANPDLLYRGTQLSQALEWLAEHPRELDQTGEDFLATARQVRDQDDQERADAEARTKRNRRLAIGALAGLAAAAVLASALALVAQGRSEANEQLAQGQRVQALATAAADNTNDQPLLAIGLALEAMAWSDPPNAVARAALVESRVELVADRGQPQPFGPPVQVGDVLSVGITADGTRFITGGRDGEVVFWDRATRTPQGRVSAHRSGVKDMAVSADGRWLVTVGQRRAQLWDLSAESPEPVLLHEIEDSGSNTIWGAALSPSGDLVGLAIEGVGVTVVGRADGQVITTGLADRNDVLSVTFLGEDRIAAGDGEGSLFLVDVDTGDEIGEPVVAGDTGNDIWEVLVDPITSEVLTVSTDHSVRWWAVTAGGFEASHEFRDERLLFPEGAVINVDQVTGTSQLIVGAADGRLYRADSVTGEVIPGSVTAALHADELADAALADSGWLVTLADDQRVQVWQLFGDGAPVDQVAAEIDPITDLALSPSGSQLAAGTAEAVVILDASTGEVEHQLLGQSAGPTVSLTWVDEQRLVAGTDSGDLELWDVEQGLLVATAEVSEQAAIRHIEISPEDSGLVVTGDSNGGLAVWKASDLTLERRLDGHGASVVGLDVTDGGQTVVSVAFDRVVRFSPIDGGSSREFTLARDGPQGLVAHPDQALVAVGSAEETVDILTEDGEVLRTLAPHIGGAWDLALSDDGLTIVVGSRGAGLGGARVSLWDWESGDQLGPNFEPPRQRGETGESPREASVVIADDGTVWSARSDGVVRRLDVLVVDVGCQISAGTIDADVRQRFLTEDELLSCR